MSALTVMGLLHMNPGAEGPHGGGAVDRGEPALHRDGVHLRGHPAHRQVIQVLAIPSWI